MTIKQPFRESTTWSIAARAVSERIRARPEFIEARQLALETALGLCRGRDVEGLRQLGGFTAVIERTIRELPEQFHLPVGSKLLPATVVTELLSVIPALRFELQRTLSEELAKST